MRLGGVVVVLVAALAWAASASAAVTHPPRLGGRSNSTAPNWAGYAESGGAYTAASATWTQPGVSGGCASGETSFSSFWVGLDGDRTSKTVEQIGTDTDCRNGTATYYAWYEMYPKPMVQLSSLTIKPGDSIHAEVSTDAAGTFTLTLTDADGSQSFSTTVKHDRHAALASAEVIAEAPSSNHGPFGTLGLSDFGSVPFTDAMINGAYIDASSADRIDMVQGGTTKATTGSLDSTGDFTVTWKNP